MALLLAHERFSEIKQAFREEQHQPENIQELLRKLLTDLQVLNSILPERGEHAAQISTPYWKCHVFYDDDDDEYSTQYREYLENSSNVIIPYLPTKEPDNSLSIRDEHLDTIPKMESDDVIKSSVKDLVPIPSESEGIFDDTCDVPFCDNFPPLDVLNDHFELFSNFNDDCTSYDDFSPINVFKEKSVLEDIECKDSYDFNLDESTFLVTPLFDSNEDEYFTPGDDVKLLLHCDPSTPIMSIVSILEGFTDEPPLEENDDLFDLESKRINGRKFCTILQLMI
nr:hypothetical protein [Tanacetum cinerariifolium]